MTTFYPLPRMEIHSLRELKEERPIAVITGQRSWEAVKSLVRLPIVVQAEPESAAIEYLDELADNLPDEVEAVYGFGGGLVCDVAKYVGWKKGLPVVVAPTVLSVDGFFTALVAARKGDVVEYVTTGPVERLIFDWDVIQAAPRRYRTAAVLELLTMVSGILDWRYAASKGKNTHATRYQEWAGSIAAGITQQVFRIAADIGKSEKEALRSLLDLVAMEVQLTNQLGHNRPQEGSEQYFAYAIEPKLGDQNVSYADMVGPGILISTVMHGQDPAGIRQTLLTIGVQLDELPADKMIETLVELKGYVHEHNLPFGIAHDLDIDEAKAKEILQKAQLI